MKKKAQNPSQDQQSLEELDSQEFSANSKIENSKLKTISFKKIFWISILTLICLFLITIGFVSWQISNYLTKFSQASQTSLDQVWHQVKLGLETEPIQENGMVYFLILGVDELEGRATEGILTDTMILASLNLNTSTVNLVSLPRDLWIDAYKTKINALYYYGEINPDKTGISFVTEVIDEILKVPIHHVVSLNLNSLGELIDILDGVEIDVKYGFRDDKFPVAGVDVNTETDPNILYETLTFNPGLQTMDGQRALKYIRSRHSSDLVAGTDSARGTRQHQLIKAIVQKLTSSQTLKDPQKMGEIYKWYQDNFGQTSLTTSQLVSLGKHADKQLPQLKSFSIPIVEEEKPGLLVNPPLDKYNQWVYEPVDPSWNQLREYLKINLKS